MALATVLRLDRHVVGQGPAHDPAHGPGGEQAQQLVVQAQVEAALARVALAARTAPELVVDAAALVALAAQHVEPAELAHLVALGRGSAPRATAWRRFSSACPSSLLEVDALGRQLVLGQQLGVAAQDDVDASAGHVGGHGDPAHADRPGPPPRPPGSAAWR